MSEDWDSIESEVSQSIMSIGFDVTIFREGPGPQSPWSDAIQMEHSFQTKAIDSGVRQRTVDGKIVLRRVLLVPAGNLKPLKGDKIQIDGRRHNIEECNPTRPGGVDLVYKLEIVA